MKTRKDYHDLHLKCDLLLLADVFERFKNKAWKNYVEVTIWVHQIEVGMQCLKWQKIKFELISDPDIFIFFWKRYKR